MTRRDGWLVLGVMVAVTGASGVVRGQAGGGSIAPPVVLPSTPATEPAPAATRPAGGSGAATMPTAESVLKDLLQDRSRETPAAGGATAGAAGAAGAAGGAEAATRPAGGGEGLVMEGALLREGQTIYGRKGKIEKGANGETVFVFTDNGNPELPPMPVVPSRRLWALEEASAGGVKGFELGHAEVTQYQGKNYLYITKDDGPPAPTATSRVPAVEAVAPNEPAAVRVREGVSVYNRVGRLTKDEKGGGMLFVFDADGKEMHDPPMGVIPSKSLTVMEEASKGGTKPVKFRVSGEITQYRGKNYLYPKVVMVVKDLNQGLGG